MWIKSLSLMVFCQFLMAGEYLVVPHIAADTQSFQTNLVLENRTDSSLNLSIISPASAPSESTALTIQANSRQRMTVESLFPGKNVPFLLVSRLEGLFAGVEYVPKANSANRTYVEAIANFSQRWRVHPSNWSQTFDGLALVNPTCENVTISVKQYTASGVFRAEIALGEGSLRAQNKLIYNLGSQFASVEGSYIEVVASAPIAAMGLKGSLSTSDFSFMVGNQAVAYPLHEELVKQVTEQRAIWLSQALAANHSYRLERSCYCPNQQIANLSFSNGELSALTDTQGTALGLGEVTTYPSIEGLFDLILDAVAQQADGVDVDFDPTYGYPTRIVIDKSLCIVDDEVSYIVTNMSAVL